MSSLRTRKRKDRRIPRRMQAPELDAVAIQPCVTWGTTPEMSVDVGGVLPDPEDEPDPNRRALFRGAYD